MGALRVSFGLPMLGLLFSTAAASVIPSFERATFPDHDPSEVALGRLLFYDPILSGNKTVSCATCHHSTLGTSDGLSLGLGDGATGLGENRVVDPDNLPEQRVPRNSPALFNLGALQFVSLFHDGRLEKDDTRPSGLRTPLEDEMVVGFDNVLSAQAMFPVLSADEMAGHYLENDVARAVRIGLITGDGGAWDIIAGRVADIEEYAKRFDEIGIDKADIAFTDIANAIGAFIAIEWRADDSPFDRYVFNGEPLPADAKAGMDIFYGKANCQSCHAGLFQTDHSFHAIAMPQVGPGKAARFENHARDTGRMHVTGDSDDAYKFRTPSLRNIEQTAPYGHSGAYKTLEEVVRHHLNPVEGLRAYNRDIDLPNLEGADDWRILEDDAEIEAIAAANELSPSQLSDSEINELIAFLKSLSDPIAAKGRLGAPESVPSGLPVDR